MPASMNERPAAVIDVLVCTYRRPDLLIRTLDGIARCAAGPGAGAVRVVVVDNDYLCSAGEAVRRWARSASVGVSYLSQPAQNISLTRNMGLAHATAPWIALIDDDEVPDPGWLAALMEAARRFDADVVFGPVISEFPDDAPAWARQGTLFQRKRFATGTVIPLKEARTGNVLLRAQRLAQDRFRFDPELGLSGGEDSEFFGRLSKAGYRMVWCDDACVREWTPPSRTRVAWVMKRAFRVGSVEAYNRRRFCHAQELCGAFVKFSLILAGGGMSAILWAPVSRARCIQSMRRTALGAGFYYGLLAGPYREYSSATVQDGSTG